MARAKELPFCVPCRQTIHIKWRQHLYTKQHERNTLNWFTSQLSRLEKQCERHEESIVSYCSFCEATMRSMEQLRDHYSSASHRKKLDGFCIRYRCDRNGFFRQKFAKCFVNAKRPKVIAEKCEEESVAPNAKIDTANAHVAGAVLSTVTSRLNAVQQERDKAMTNSDALDSKCCGAGSQENLHGPVIVGVRSSVRSPQNAMESGERERSLEGIIKVRKPECVPWRMDKIMNEERKRNLQALAEMRDRVGNHYRVTEFAAGAGLDRIDRVNWSESMGNVHTGAIPPWLVDSNAEYMQQNQIKLRTIGGPSESVTLKSVKKRDIFAKLAEESEYTSDWLPNFGGVWQEGPRSKTKRDFVKKIKSTGRTRLENSRALSIAPQKTAQHIEREAASTVPPASAKEDELCTSKPSSISAMDQRITQLMLKKQRLREKIAACTKDSK